MPSSTAKMRTHRRFRSVTSASDKVVSATVVLNPAWFFSGISTPDGNCVFGEAIDDSLPDCTLLRKLISSLLRRLTPLSLKLNSHKLRYYRWKEPLITI